MINKAELGGWVAGIAAFIWWGLVPIYFKLIDSVGTAEILAHRVLWSVPVTIILMLALRKPIRLVEVLKNKKLLLALIASTSLISVNWYIFTWAVTNGDILATSLGYFINPVFSILLGVIVLNEKLSKFQWAAVVLVAMGVANQIFNYGEFPWIALSLATSFALYGLLKKKIQIDSLNGLLVEVTLALPIAAVYIIWISLQDKSSFLHVSVNLDLLLVLGGVVTAVPLILFASAAKKIPLNAIGFLQFLGPSIAFVLATQVYGETLNNEQLMSFVLIWVGLSLYLVKPFHLLLRRKKRNE